MKSSAIPCLCVLAAISAVSCARKVAPSNETAPATFNVLFDTTRGPVAIIATRTDSPQGVDRFYNLVKANFFDGARFFRVVPGFVVQFGLAADPKLTSAWDVPIHDDPVIGSNLRGTLTFAASGPDTRTSQMFFNLGNNQRLDSQPSHFAVVGRVVSGMENVDRIYAGYREKPQQSLIEKTGNAYLDEQFPSLDYIRTARLTQ